MENNSEKKLGLINSHFVNCKYCKLQLIDSKEKIESFHSECRKEIKKYQLDIHSIIEQLFGTLERFEKFNEFLTCRVIYRSAFFDADVSLNDQEIKTFDDLIEALSWITSFNQYYDVPHPDIVFFAEKNHIDDYNDGRIEKYAREKFRSYYLYNYLHYYINDERKLLDLIIRDFKDYSQLLTLNNISLAEEKYPTVYSNRGVTISDTIWVEPEANL